MEGRAQQFTPMQVGASVFAGWLADMPDSRSVLKMVGLAGFTLQEGTWPV
jgi:hypothetical protein